MPEEIVSAENTVQTDVVAESQPAGDIDGQEGIDLSTPASDGAQTAEKDSLTKKMSERINKIRATEVEPLKAKLTDYEKKEAEWREKEIELRAFKEGKTVDEIMAEETEQERLRREMIESDPEVKQVKERLKDIEFKTQYNEVLGAIKAAFPDDNITKLEDLDPVFGLALASGKSPVEAYEAHRIFAKKNQPPKKELPGSVKGAENAIAKEFYTREEVKAMSRDEIEKNYDSIMESTKQWT